MRHARAATAELWCRAEPRSATTTSFMQRTYSRKGARRISRSAASSPERDNDTALQRKRRKIQVEVVRQPEETTDGGQERPQHTDTKSRGETRASGTSDNSANSPRWKERITEFCQHIARRRCARLLRRQHRSFRPLPYQHRPNERVRQVRCSARMCPERISSRGH